MRLIDADALLDALDRSAIYGWSLQEDAAARRWAERVVELMPTVETEPGLYVNLADKVTVTVGIEDGKEMTQRTVTVFEVIDSICEDYETHEVRRPARGTWMMTDAYPHKVYCSNCYKTFAQDSWGVWRDGTLPRNFCPCCGADMRGEQ